MDDRRIVELFLERSEEAILETDIKYGRYCHKIAFNVLGNDEDSEECVNDAYMRAWGSIPPNEPDSMASYIGRITRNLALDKLRQKQSDKRGNGEVPVVLDELDECFAADVRLPLRKLAEGFGFRYLRAYSIEGMKAALPTFFGQSDVPVILDIVTDGSLSAAELNRYFDEAK